VFRIYRDVRFAHDKRPYRKHAACRFRHALGKDVQGPGFYVYFAPREICSGGLRRRETGPLARTSAPG
jgi:uncharacterized protein (DUF2461 family)